MKKQIFILVILVLETFANVDKSFGQKAVHSTILARPLTCTIDGLNPVAGVPYTYGAAINPVGGTAVWHAVYNQTTFMTNGLWVPTDETLAGSFLSTTTGYGSNAAAASPTQTTITWKTNGLSTVNLAHPLFVALEYTAPAPGCTNNNLQVFLITPKNGFTLDITNMAVDGSAPVSYGTNVSQCYANIASASYNGTAVVMDYGINTMYFEVIAANFTTSFTPTFKISGLLGGQRADISWGYTPGTTTTVIKNSATNETITSGIVETDAPNTSTGVSIYVKVVVHNNSYEGLIASNITLAVEAINTANQHDVKPDCTVTTAGTDDFEDIATQTLSLRPVVNAPTPGSFIPKI